MKKIIIFVLIITILATLFSCKKEESTKVTEYTTSTEVYNLKNDDGEVSVTYPVLTETGGGELYTSQLKNAALEKMELYLRYNNATGYYHYTVDVVSAKYTGEKLASFLCMGNYTDEGSSYPDTIVYTLNINPQNGEIYEFEDLISDFDSLAEKFTSGKFMLVSGVDWLLDMTNLTDMFVEYSSLYKIYPPVYFIDSEDGVQLAVSVGLVYALGGHAEFSIDIDSVKDAMTDTLREIIF